MVKKIKKKTFYTYARACAPRERWLKLKIALVVFPEALHRNGFRYEVIKNMATRRMVLTACWRSDTDRAKPNYSVRYEITPCLRITACQRAKQLDMRMHYHGGDAADVRGDNCRWKNEGSARTFKRVPAINSAHLAEYKLTFLNSAARYTRGLMAKPPLKPRDCLSRCIVRESPSDFYRWMRKMRTNVTWETRSTSTFYNPFISAFGITATGVLINRLYFTQTRAFTVSFFFTGRKAR